MYYFEILSYKQRHQHAYFMEFLCGARTPKTKLIRAQTVVHIAMRLLMDILWMRRCHHTSQLACHTCTLNHEPPKVFTQKHTRTSHTHGSFRRQHEVKKVKKAVYSVPRYAYAHTAHAYIGDHPAKTRSKKESSIAFVVIHRCVLHVKGATTTLFRRWAITCAIAPGGTRMRRCHRCHCMCNSFSFKPYMRMCGACGC